jgi:hypothetical protein
MAKQVRAVAACAVTTLALLTASFVPAQAVSATQAAPAKANAAQPGVTYHGGPVQHASAAFAIFWAPAGFAFPSGYAALVTRYFTDVAHDSYMPSNPYAVSTQYYSGSGTSKNFESYNVALKTVVVDTNAYPKNGCKNYPLGDGSKSRVCLTHAQIEKKLKAVIAAKNFPTGLGTDYFVFTPQGVASCSKADEVTTGGCYNPLQYNGYCAYHSHVGAGAKAVIYAQLPYAALAGCTSGQSPNGNAADAVLNNLVHEHNESMTDPLGNAWYDAAGHEIGDKCHLMFGTPRGSTANGPYNEVINGNVYWLQELWSNRAGACVQRNTYPQPRVAFSYKPSAPVHGKKVTFTSSVKEAGESHFTYRWTFPDGGSSSAKNPTHTFATTIFAGVVTLVACDSHGGQTRTSKFITVS